MIDVPNKAAHSHWNARLNSEVEQEEDAGRADGG